MKKGGNCVYKTVFVNGEEVNEEDTNTKGGQGGVTLENDVQLDEDQRQVLIEHVYSLRDELDKRERYWDGRYNEDQQDLRSYTDKMQKLEKVNCDLNKGNFFMV